MGMANVVPHTTKVSSEIKTYETEADFNLVRKILNEGPVYRIPAESRHKLVEAATKALDSPNGSPRSRMAAGKMLIEMDKINVQMAKSMIPRQIQHFNARESTNEELMEIVQRAAEHLPPDIKEKILAKRVIDVLPTVSDSGRTVEGVEQQT